MTGSIARKVVEVFRTRPSGAPELDQLTEREAAVLELLAEGLLYKEISERLSASIGTINTLVFRIYNKLHVHTRHDAVSRYRAANPPPQ